MSSNNENAKHKKKPTEPPWFFKKKLLPKNLRELCALAKDSSLNSAAKGYTTFINIEELLNFLTTLPPNEIPHYYEIIQNIYDYPCHCYFDVDRILNPETDADILSNLSGYYDNLINKFIMYFEKFLKTIYNHDVTLKIGVNVNIGSSITKYKLSAHIIINIRCPNVLFMKDVAHNFDKYLSSNAYGINDADKQLFYYKKSESIHCIIDSSVYCNFRLFRCLYSSKFQTNGTPLIPYEESSNHIKDHLVLHYPSIHDSNIKTLSPSNVEIVTDYSKIGKTSICTSMAPDINEKHQSMVPIQKVNEIKNILINSNEAKTLLKTNEFVFSDILPSFAHCYTFIIDKKCNCYCPYADKIHKHNRSYFFYNHLTGKVQYKCFDDECKAVGSTKKAYLTFNVSYEKDYILRHNMMSCDNTLHCKNQIIKWNEEYDSPSMKHYPLQPITLIRANMGVGKTKELNAYFIPQHVQENTKCLFITYQRILAKKYFNELKNYGFINYLDVEGDIHEPKVIVCLDSLNKVKTKNFDFVFIDEVMSVLMHFNSSQMKNKTVISAQFEKCLEYAKYVYLLDAHVDNTIVYNLGLYLTNLKGQGAMYCIKNNFVRSSNRKATAFYNNNKPLEKQFRYTIIEQVCELLKSNKRVVVSSSTKSFTEQLQLEINERFDNKRTIMYNSDTDRAIINSHAENTEEVWKDCDCLIYSPTITAGISFESEHFHQLVSYVENSLYTPTIDNVLQQMFRVRCLIDGNMTIYINFCHHLKTSEYPVHENEIILWLDSYVTSLNEFYPEINGIKSLSFESPINTKTEDICYEKDRLSFTTLTGIVYNKNKSIRQLVGTLRMILKDDYNIDCTLENFQPADDVITKTIKFQKRWRAYKTSKIITFSDDLIVDDDMYEELCKKKNEETHMTDKEKLQKWSYDAAFELWNVPRSSINKNFFNNYIGQCDSFSINEIITLYHQATRYVHLIDFSLSDNKNSFKNKMDWIRSQNDPNLDLYDKKNTEYYHKLIEAQTLLEKLCTREEYTSGNNVLVSFARFDEYIKTMSEEKYEFILKLFEFQARYWSGHENKTALSNGDLKKRNAFVERVIKEIGLDMTEPDKKQKNPIKADFGWKIIRIAPLIASLKNIYRAGMFTLSNKVIIANDDYIDPLDR